MKTVRRPPYPKWNPGYFPCSSLTPLPLSSRRPSVSFGGFGLKETGHPVPFVKRVTVSTLFGKPYFLDGHNNPGFSGGPVVFCPPARKEFQVAAVVSGYRSARAPIRDDEDRDTEFHLRENTGIVVAYDVNEAVALIRANPIGLVTGQE